MSNEVVTRVDAEGNATLMLNRLQVHNAFDPAMTRLLTASLEKLAADPKVRAVVLLGAGKSFCAGADIGHMKASAKYSREQNYRSAQESARMFYTLYNLPKPTIACVHGAVRGGGIGLVAACDIAIAARTTTLRLSEVKIGVIPSMISPYVIAAIGERMSRRIAVIRATPEAQEGLTAFLEKRKPGAGA